jgi:von Willebrand factor type A domain
VADFRIECFQNEHIPEGRDQINVVVCVAATGTGDWVAMDPASRSEIIMIDTSESMGGTKLKEAKGAASTAIECLPDGTRFGIISCGGDALFIYPVSTPLAVSSPSTRAEANNALKLLKASGTKAVAKGIGLASGAFRGRSGTNHAVLLTDGIADDGDIEMLDQVLEEARTVFRCDCRGVGAKWEVGMLQRVATTLDGTYDVLSDPSGWERDVSSMFQAFQDRPVSDVALQVSIPNEVEVEIFNQMEPFLDLSERRQEGADSSRSYSLGRWGDEARDYFLTLRMPSQEVGSRMDVAQLTLLVGGESVDKCIVRATWTDDATKSMAIHHRVADVQVEFRLVDLIQEGIDAHRDGNVDLARMRMKEALGLAMELGNTSAVERLLRFLGDEPDDPGGGNRVREPRRPSPTSGSGFQALPER